MRVVSSVFGEQYQLAALLLMEAHSEYDEATDAIVLGVNISSPISEAGMLAHEISSRRRNGLEDCIALCDGDDWRSGGL